MVIVVINSSPVETETPIEPKGCTREMVSNYIIEKYSGKIEPPTQTNHL